MLESHWDGDWVIAQNQFKRGVCPVRMSSIIVSEFEGAEGFMPVFGVRGTIDGKVRFDLLIDSFGGSIGLWMIGGRKGRCDVQ